MATIAVVEDDQPIGNLLQEALEKEGYRVLRAQTVVRHGVALENFVMEKWLPPR